MNVIFALCYLGDPSPTGGVLYNQNLYAAWRKSFSVQQFDLKKFWFLLHCPLVGWMLKYGFRLQSTSWLVQSASSGFFSRGIIFLIRWSQPDTRHLGIVHHPRWMENPTSMRSEVTLYNSFDRLLAISHHVKEILISAGVNVPIDVLLPGYTPPDSPRFQKGEPPLILWNGHLLSRKGPDILLTALQILPSYLLWRAVFLSVSSPDLRFATAFHHQFSEVERTTAGRIKYVTRLPRPEFNAVLSEATLFCLPSLVEGYSIATVEAISAGCIVVVPRTFNFRELLGTDDYPGFFDLGDVNSLSATLIALLDNPTTRATAKAILDKRIAQLPTWTRFEELAIAYSQCVMNE